MAALKREFTFLTRISHQLCWKIKQSVFSRFQVALAGNVHKHFQESHLEYSERQMFQDSPESGEKCGLSLKKAAAFLSPGFALDRAIYRAWIVRGLRFFKAFFHHREFFNA